SRPRRICADSSCHVLRVWSDGTGVGTTRTGRNVMAPALPTQSEASHAARYEALLRVLHLLTAQRSPTALFRVLARELRPVATCDGLSFPLYDGAVRQHYCHALEIEPQPGVVPLTDVPVEETMTWWVYNYQQPLVIPAVDTETRFPQLMALQKT